jgi:hypothetical protein
LPYHPSHFGLEHPWPYDLRAIAYEVLRQENPSVIDRVTAILEKHPWYANQWQTKVQDVPGTDRDMALFMQAARCADDARIRNKQTIGLLGAARKELI